MEVKACRVSKKSDEKSFCSPSEGYGRTVTVDIKNYTPIIKNYGTLEESDQQFPLGAPIDCYVFYEGSLYELK